MRGKWESPKDVWLKIGTTTGNIFFLLRIVSAFQCHCRHHYSIYHRKDRIEKAVGGLTVNIISG